MRFLLGVDLFGHFGFLAGRKVLGMLDDAVGIHAVPLGGGSLWAFWVPGGAEGLGAVELHTSSHLLNTSSVCSLDDFLLNLLCLLDGLDWGLLHLLRIRRLLGCLLRSGLGDLGYSLGRHLSCRSESSNI